MSYLKSLKHTSILVFLALAASVSVAAPGESVDPSKALGEQTYRLYCQACHMADAKGATGAATVPALAGNERLAAAAYPIMVLLNGRAGMPWFNGILKPEELAAVVGHVRTHFGNNYTDPVTTEEVVKLAGPAPKE